MAALHSTMVNSRGNTISTINHRIAQTMVETWDVTIETTLTKDGVYEVLITERKTGRIINRIEGCYPCPERG